MAHVIQQNSIYLSSLMFPIMSAFLTFFALSKRFYRTFMFSEKQSTASLTGGKFTPVLFTPALELQTTYGGQEPSRNRVVAPTRHTTQTGRIDSWPPYKFKNTVSAVTSFPRSTLIDRRCMKLPPASTTPAINLPQIQ